MATASAGSSQYHLGHHSSHEALQTTTAKKEKKAKKNNNDHQQEKEDEQRSVLRVTKVAPTDTAKKTRKTTLTRKKVGRSNPEWSTQVEIEEAKQMVSQKQRQQQRTHEQHQAALARRSQSTNTSSTTSRKHCANHTNQDNTNCMFVHFSVSTLSGLKQDIHLPFSAAFLPFLF